MKKLLKVVKIILGAVLCVVFLKNCGCAKRNESNANLHYASAETVSEETIENVDFSAFPYNNYWSQKALYDFWKEGYTGNETITVNNITLGLQNSIILTTRETSAGNNGAFTPGLKLADMLPGIKEGDTVIYSFDVTESVPNKFLYIQGYGVIYRNTPIQLNYASLNGKITFYGNPSSAPGQAEISNIRFNKGATLYDYQPNYLDYYYYGQKLGENQAIERYNLGLLRGSTFNIQVEYEQGQTVTAENLTPNITYNGINFNTAWKNYELYQGDRDNAMESVLLTLNLKEPFLFNMFPVYFIGDNDVFDVTVISQSGDRYTAQINQTGTTEKEEDRINITGDYPGTLIVSAIQIKFGRAVDTFYNANIIIKSGDWLEGYNTGFTEGNEEGTQSGYENGFTVGKNDGYTSGYNQGITDGYNEAVAEGLNTNGIFNAALNILKTLVLLLGQLFSKPIAGDLTIGFFVIGVPMTFKVIEMVINLIQKFTSNN